MIWRSGRDGSGDLDDMTRPTLMMLGVLGAAKDITNHRMAVALEVTDGYAAELHRRLLSTNHPSILHMRREGLPITYSEPIAGDMLCAECEHRLTTVPCVFCACKGSKRQEKVLEVRECGRPTDHLPGSSEKVMVMANRVRRGYSAFCEGDVVDLSVGREQEPRDREVFYYENEMHPRYSSVRSGGRVTRRPS